jgi:glycosyltransferase involved in cell wall biosynthesis
MTSQVFSIIIPVYNRAWSVRRAVESAIAFSNGSMRIEIILIDDASTDNSVEIIEKLIEVNLNLPSVTFKLIRHAVNKGVCGAKNSGAMAASGIWLVFLDSDDELVNNTASDVYKALMINEKYPLHFFKCIGENDLVTPEVSNNFQLRNFKTYLKNGTDGEALPVIKTVVFINHLYDEDVRGYESLCYLRIVKAYSSAVINSLIVRRYYTSHDDRLSSKEGMKQRYRDLAKGHRRVIREHWVEMSAHILFQQYLRYIKSILLKYYCI